MASKYSDGYRLTWRGSTVLREIDARINTAMARLQKDIESYLQSNLHRWTGQMADESFAELEIQQGGRRKLTVGSDAPHTYYHEKRYHPQLREALDTWAPRVTEYMRSAIQ